MKNIKEVKAKKNQHKQHKKSKRENNNMSKTGTAYIDHITDDGIAVMVIDYFPVNALSAGLTNGVKTVIRQLEGRDPGIDQKVTGLVVTGAGDRAFCAGADIMAFNTNRGKPVSIDRPTTGPFGMGLEDNQIGGVNIPVVAAINGFALGGGLELALTCHYRVATANSNVGLPEVNIGLLPGGQGTQRLPRIIGSEQALEAILSGDQIPAPKALELGIINEMVPSKAELIDAAIAMARKNRGKAVQPSIAKMPPPAPCDFDSFRKRMASKRKGQPAAEAIIKCVEAACKGPWDYGRKQEGVLFGPLAGSPEGRAMLHMFSAERAGKKVSDLPKGVKGKKIKTVGVVGAGLMGGGIAMCCANVGMKVTILDIDQKNLDRGMALIDANYARSRSMSAEQKAAARANFTPTINYDDLAHCDMIVEAVFESLDIKQKIFEQLDGVCKPDAFLCTNTSALDIDAIAGVCKPERRPLVMGTHFFSPANVMKLLENVRGKETSDYTIATMMQWGTEIGKWCILAGNCQGFVGNRMVAFYSGAARGAIAQGALPEEVDYAATEFGMKMGPMAMADLVGLDLGIQAWKKAGTYNPEKVPQHGLIEMGRLGQKSNAGWFDYEDNRNGTPSKVVNDMLRKMYPLKGSPPSQQEITLSLYMPMINEGFKILEEGMAQKPSDIDVCYVYGYNFPKVRGGPMFYADTVGLPTVKKTLETLGIKPAKLLEDCIAADMSLTQYWGKHGGKQWAAAKGQTHPTRARKAKM